MTTVCLTPEPKRDVETGSVKPAVAAEGIETGALLPAEAASSLPVPGEARTPADAQGLPTLGDALPTVVVDNSAGLPLNYPRIGYANVLRLQTVTAEIGVGSSPLSEETKLNPTSPDTYRRLQVPNGVPNFRLSYVWTSAATVDYIAIAAHTLAEKGGNVRILTSENGVDWVGGESKTVTTNDAVLFFFESVQARGIRIEVTAGNNNAYEIGVIYTGELLQVERPFYGGHSPVKLAANDTWTPQVSDSGNFLGRSLVRRGYKTSVEINNLTAAWYRANFQPFVEDAKLYPFFFAWNLRDYPDEIAFGWVNNNIIPSNTGTRDLMSVRFELESHR